MSRHTAIWRVMLPTRGKSHFWALALQETNEEIAVHRYPFSSHKNSRKQSETCFSSGFMVKQNLQALDGRFKEKPHSDRK